MINVDFCLPTRSGGAAIRSAVRLLGGRLVPGFPRLQAASRLVGFPPGLLPITEQLAAGRLHAKRLTSGRSALQSP